MTNKLQKIGVSDFKKNFKNKLNLENNVNDIKKKYNNAISHELEKLNFLKFVEVAKGIDKKPFYIPHHADFRGRMYSSSQLSPILHKYIRYIITYTKHTTADINILEENMTKTKAYNIIIKYVNKLENLNLKINRPIIQTTILFLLVELSKKNKTKLMDSITFSVDLETLITEGLKIY